MILAKVELNIKLIFLLELEFTKQKIHSNINKKKQ